jgi:hypothetical protein
VWPSWWRTATPWVQSVSLGLEGWQRDVDLIHGQFDVGTLQSGCAAYYWCYVDAAYPLLLAKNSQSRTEIAVATPSHVVDSLDKPAGKSSRNEETSGAF